MRRYLPFKVTAHRSPAPASPVPVLDERRQAVVGSDLGQGPRVGRAGRGDADHQDIAAADRDPADHPPRASRAGG